MASTASSRPTGPTRSPVLALRPTCSVSMASISAIRRRIASRRGANLGRSINTTQSRLPICQPAARTLSAAIRNMSLESRPRFASSELGNIWPMSPKAAAPNKASVMAWSNTSASLWPTSCRSCGTDTPPRRRGPPGSIRCVSCPMPTRKRVVVMSPLQNRRAGGVSPPLLIAQSTGALRPPRAGQSMRGIIAEQYGCDKAGFPDLALLDRRPRTPS